MVISLLVCIVLNNSLSNHKNDLTAIWLTHYSNAYKTKGLQLADVDFSLSAKAIFKITICRAKCGVSGSNVPL